MNGRYGIGIEGHFKSSRISLFWGVSLLTIAFWTPVHKYKWRFYKYSNIYIDGDLMIDIKWFFGLQIKVD